MTKQKRFNNLKKELDSTSVVKVKKGFSIGLVLASIAGYFFSKNPLVQLLSLVLIPIAGALYSVFTTEEAIINLSNNLAQSKEEF